MLTQLLILPTIESILEKIAFFVISIFDNLLVLVLVVPLLTFFILLGGSYRFTNDNLYQFSLISSGISFVLSCLLA